jgi:uroporphyrinogen-III synthase
MRLLVTRPEPEAERSAQALRAKGHEALVAPLLRLEPQEEMRLYQEAWAGILITSANALRALTPAEIEALTPLPLLAVGRKTAEAARAAGFSNVRSAEGDASALARLAAEVFGPADGPLAYLAGETRAFDIPAALAMHGIPVHTLVVYQMVTADEFPEAVRAALAERRVDGVLHYSRRTAEAYLHCADRRDLRQAALEPVHYCLSAEIGTVLLQAGAQNVRHAARPEESALFELIAAP